MTRLIVTKRLPFAIRVGALSMCIGNFEPPGLLEDEGYMSISSKGEIVVEQKYWLIVSEELFA